MFIRASSDWLYYKGMFGNQYLWGNNPYSRYKMVDIETMKTIYDPCPAGYKISPPDVYGAFLKEPIIMYSLKDDDFAPNIIGHVGEMKAKSFYTPSFTEYGAYFYCGGENSARKVYFISAGIRLADVYEVQPGYTAHLSGTMTSIFGDGMNTVMSFTIATHDSFYCSFGGVDGLSELRASAAQVRCVRDE